ncbi:major capsid protein [Aquipseudomonas ullengensis]|uniref:Major capsid protein n=1 Tax=Aquipseudomonas ullengensis TaxID=2759166 RepID=A0A7W4LJX1_9GAMM|nr:major capsid protein [Pseudomonas ullengensis]MBB2494486.1 major capsid protein [Pseudomonas ullengensis]
MNQLNRFTRSARNLALVVGVSVFSAGQAMAAAIPIDISGIEEQINAGATSAGSVAGYVALALAVLACAGVIFGMLRKS